MIVSSHANKTHFHKKGFARSLGPKKRFWNSGNSLFFLLRKHGWTCYLHSCRSHVFWEKNKKKKHRKWIVSKSTTVDFYSFVVRFCWSFFKNRAREKGKHKWRHHDVISLVCTLIEHSSPPISAREIAQLSWKRKSKFLWWGLLAEMKSMNVGNFFWLSFVCCVLHLRRWSTLKFTRVYNNISSFFVRHFFVVPWPRSLTNNRLPVCFWDRYIRVNLFLMLFHHARVLLT